MRVHDREDQIAREEELLSAQAAKSSQSKGRTCPRRKISSGLAISATVTASSLQEL